MEQTQIEKFSLINGRIHTQSGIASNITFEHGRIVSLDDEISALNGRIIDIHGRTVLPGFCDAGFDLLTWAENQERLNLANVRSNKEFIDSLDAYFHANSTPLRGWYVAYDLPDDIVISRDDLDSVIPSLPCAIIDAKNTHVMLNTPAMNELNMPQDSVEPDEFNQHLPELSEENIIYLIKTYTPKLNAFGISEIWANFFDTNINNAKRLWDILLNDAYDSLNLRLRCNFGFNDVASLNDFLSSGLRTGDGLPFCKLGGIIVKGSLEQQEQKDMIYSAHLSGCQIISDNNKSCLNALERVIKKVRKPSRHIIKNFTGSLIERMKVLGLGGIISLGQDNEFLHEAFRNGLVLSGSSEKILDAIGDFVLNGLSVAEALNIFTWGAAWNGGYEARRGELAVGNDADIVVLEQDPFSVRPEEISKIDVTMTFSAGSAVYDSGNL